MITRFEHKGFSKKIYGTERIAKIVPNTLGITPSRIQFNEATYFLTDHLGNTRVAYMATTTTNHDAYIINAVDYYPYGKVLREYDNGAGDRYMTTQHERDRETGLDYRGARYYDSDIARFLSLDPLAAKYPMLSAYNYVAGNPIIFIDPDGREIRNSKGEDISTPKHEKETRWTENHVRLNEAFGDANGFNKIIAPKVEFSTLISNYPMPYEHKPNRAPADREIPANDYDDESFLYPNQCAIRVSIALIKSGVPLKGVKNKTNPGGQVYDANGNVLGALNLANHLAGATMFGTPQKINGINEDALSMLEGRTGIIFFQGYNHYYGFNVPESRGNSNVHIDLWNKNTLMSPYTDQMLNSTTIWFWEIK